jgi:hypothetical protein
VEAVDLYHSLWSTGIVRKVGITSAKLPSHSAYAEENTAKQEFKNAPLSTYLAFTDNTWFGVSENFQISANIFANLSPSTVWAIQWIVATLFW